MSEVEIYTDETVLVLGDFKGYKLNQVPPIYLLKLHKHRKGISDKALVNYVEKNIEGILEARRKDLPYFFENKVIEKAPLEEIKQSTAFVEQKPVCTKKQFPTKKDARDALKIIRNSPGNHKKPIRSYECPHCSAWHHTSMPIEVWKEKEKLLKRSKK